VSATAAALARSGSGFDFFSVDFEEEFSGLSGFLLLQQTSFVNDCIRYIQSLYQVKYSNNKQVEQGTLALLLPLT
jgi:hypothetical protein